MREELRTQLERRTWGQHISMWLYTSGKGGTSVATGLTMEKVNEGEMFGQSPIQLSTLAAQELMDQLWQAGLRPSEGSGSAGSLKATERHLEDMRKLVFKSEP